MARGRDKLPKPHEIKAVLGIESDAASMSPMELMNARTAKLWADYHAQPTDERRNAIAVEYIGMVEKIGLKKIFGSENPFPWMSEILDLRKEKNFFETRVTEYQTGGSLDWE